MIDHTDNPAKKRASVRPLMLVALTAVVMGLPTVRGGFVGGDDHRLALDHVLVNHPSVEHAVELFAITHRDLYQPLPLLSFSAEFVVSNWLGLTRGGPERFAWLFHLDNVWLHAINTLLVWWTVAMLHGRVRRNRSPDDDGSVPAREAVVVATVAAIIFAAHPLNTEVVAWVNGRMMLLSTLFGLLALLALHAWLDRTKQSATGDAPRTTGGYWLVPVILLATLCCAISKIRIGLPVLMLIVAWAGRERLRSRRFLPVWMGCAAITVVFVVINVRATAAANLFAGGAEHLHGPRVIRVLSALAFYFTHFIHPVGLASYYPTPPTVSWSDATTWHAILVVVPVLVLLAWASWRSCIWRYGVLWFFATMAATLPIIPARNVLAADRYMYLPIIGLVWPTAVTLVWIWHHVIARTSGWIRRGLAPAAAVIVILAMIGQCWNIEWYYETPLKKTLRVALMFPDVPRVWERLGWSYYKNGDYDAAVELANRELRHDAPNVRSGAYQLIGMSAYHRGDTPNALAKLHEAIDVDPDNALAKYRLASVYSALGEYETALPYFEQASEAAPLHNTTLHRLALVYKNLNRRNDARRAYAREIENNAYEIGAYVALAEMEIEDGDVAALQHARQQLLDLLDGVSDSATARITLGLVEFQLGRIAKAAKAYQHVLSLEPNHVTALLNLAELYESQGDSDHAGPLYDRAAAQPLSIAEAAVVCDFYVSLGSWDRAESIWTDRLTRDPQAIEARGHFAWTRALRGDVAPARDVLAKLDPTSNTPPLIDALRAFVALNEQRYEQAILNLDQLIQHRQTGAPMRQRLLTALELFDRTSPGNPWTFCLAARLLMANDQTEAAQASIELCQARCHDEQCGTEVAAVVAELDRITKPE